MSKLTFGNLSEDQDKKGLRDAFHAPAILCQINIDNCRTCPDDVKFVRFTDEECTEVAPCEREQAHGVVDPFVELEWYMDNKLVWVLLKPGIVTNLYHAFEMELEPMSDEEKSLRAELKQRREEDPNCAECWQIEGGRVIRY
ncbi:MAG: hypothetical protein ACW96M_05375 [Candidatus Thorarchaeota archaeon]|jgi:hypothetical protein